MLLTTEIYRTASIHTALFGSILTLPYVLSFPAPNYNDQSYPQTLSLHTSLFSRVKISSQMDLFHLIPALKIALRKTEKIRLLHVPREWILMVRFFLSLIRSTTVVSYTQRGFASDNPWPIVNSVAKAEHRLILLLRTFIVRRFRFDWVGYFAMCSINYL